MSQPYSLIITPPIDPVNTGYTTGLDLSQYIDPNQGKGLDPSDPKFSAKVFSRSLLKAGGTLALENLELKELVFPLWLTAASPSLGDALITQINNTINAPGAVAAWRDIGTSQATYFDLASAQLDILYDFRRTQGGQWVMACTLRLFSQPLGRTASLSPLMLAGGATNTFFAVGPLIKFVAGSTIAGDAPGLLDAILTGAVGPISSGHGNLTAMSVLPDTLYQPQLTFAFLGANCFIGTEARAVGGTYIGATSGSNSSFVAQPPFQAAVTAGMTIAPPRYAGRFRLIALARSVGATGTIGVYPSGYAGPITAVTYLIPVGDWTPVDLGALTIAEAQQIGNLGLSLNLTPASSTQPVEITALYCLPERSTCLLNPALATLAENLGNTSPNIEFAGTFNAGRGRVYDVGTLADVSSAAKGTVPQADPAVGPPAMAFLSIPVGSPTNNPQNLNWSVQVNIQPRTRFVFP